MGDGMTFWNNLRHRFTSKAIDHSDVDAYPLREYVASMAKQLAELARSDGDRPLADALEAAAKMARKPEKQEA